MLIEQNLEEADFDARYGAAAAELRQRFTELEKAVELSTELSTSSVESLGRTVDILQKLAKRQQKLLDSITKLLSDIVKEQLSQRKSNTHFEGRIREIKRDMDFFNAEDEEAE